ncbi:hypothetical protein SADUNF_Sadunf07G0023800 [Salix dunnii]|uniref:Uncharacterized protein n=1 Tax=Salix dunnii TaxID=1413687 RepID=A0A835K2Q2_9ROSI|nr:hypothetical protein SADUNF_Sadunf07G0023800 [Salix dunnii]
MRFPLQSCMAEMLQWLDMDKGKNNLLSLFWALEFLVCTGRKIARHIWIGVVWLNNFLSQHVLDQLLPIWSTAISAFEATLLLKT